MVMENEIFAVHQQNPISRLAMSIGKRDIRPENQFALMNQGANGNHRNAIPNAPHIAMNMPATNKAHRPATFQNGATQMLGIQQANGVGGECQYPATDDAGKE